MRRHPSSLSNMKHTHGDECSACLPPYVFRHRPTEEIFQDYSWNMRRMTVSALLGIYILLTAVLAILYFVYQKTATERNLYHVCLCVLGISLYIFINTKFMKTRRQLRIVSYMLWMLLLLFAVISLPLGIWSTASLPESALGGVDADASNRVALHPADGLWQYIFIIYAMYLILPVNFFLVLPCGITLSVIHMVVMIVRLEGVNLLGDAWIQVKAAETCLPRYLCSDVCADLTMYHSLVCPRQIFARSYDCVSIVYIHITGLDRLSNQLSAEDFMSAVNDLTLTFEALCEHYGCLPLTMLGDCYVAVSGIPINDSAAEGPRAVVSLALDMIQALQLMQHSKGVSMEAVPGVHYGSVTTGVIGTYRWRFKGCSNDLVIAKHVAMTGSPGKVHITEPCIRYLPLDQYEVLQSNISHGINFHTFLLSHNPNVKNFQMSGALMKLSRKLSKVHGNGGSVSSFIRLESVDDEDPFYAQLSRANDSKPSMSTCLLEGKAFVHRTNADHADGDAATRAFRQFIAVSSVEQEISLKMSFFTLRFKDRFIESRFSKESGGFGLSLTFLFILLISLATLHFALLPRTMMMLASVLFLFLIISILLISLLASKLGLVKAKCLTHSTNTLALTIIILSLVTCASIVNVLTCRPSSFYTSLPLVFRYSILSEDVLESHFPSTYYVILSGVVLLFMVSVTRISHLVQAILITIICVGYLIIFTYTHSDMFEAFDTVYSYRLPPAGVIAIVVLLHFALLHILVGRHSELVRRIDYLWRHDEITEYQKAQDAVTLRQGIAENGLPSHAVSHYNSPECLMKPYSKSHSMVGVAFVTIPNFPAYVLEMCNLKQQLPLVQVLHDVTSAFDHLLKRGDFHVVEKVYDQNLTLVLTSGIKESFINTNNQASIEMEYLIHHLCKLLDLLLDMKHCLQQLNAMSGRNLVLRAGVSMGHIVEGVVGYKRPQYNVWGPAVDMARKLELTGKMNNIQVNKEVAQTLKRQFQFQPRTQANILQELQPYIVQSRRLQSVIASDNVSLASEEQFSPRQAVQHNQSAGSISQAETVMVSSQQPLLSSTYHSRNRAFESRSEPFTIGSNSTESTPSGSFTRNVSRDSSREGIHPSWKLLPQNSSVVKLSSRPMSPELPTVHYSKAKSSPSKRSDSRGTIILTQANLTGISTDSYQRGDNSTAELVFPSMSSQQSSLPKLATVVNTDNVSRLGSVSSQLSPVDELSMSRARRKDTSSPHAHTPRTSQHARSTTSDSLPSSLGRTTPASVGYPCPQSPPPQILRQSPALSYTRTPASPPTNHATPPTHRKSSRPSSRASSSGDNNRWQASNKSAMSADREDTGDIELLRGLSVPTSTQSKPTILGLERVMTTSMYSDKMQTSMEGNVSSTSTTPDDDSPLMMRPPPTAAAASLELNNINADPSLSPILKHQLNRFAKSREPGGHKSPHLPRKRSYLSSAARTGGNSICSLSPPTTPDHSVGAPASNTYFINSLQNTVENGNDTQRSDAASSSKSKSSGGGKSQSSAISKSLNTTGVKPKQSNPVLTGPPPPLPAPASSTESDLSDDDNINPGRRKLEASATDYDNMYSTDYGTYSSHVVANPSRFAKEKPIAEPSTKFVCKLEKMQTSDCNVRELYSELESDAADCESLVGDTDYETESGLPSHPPTSADDYSHPLQKLQWTENKLLALLRPLQQAGTHSTVGSTLRHCRSLEMLRCENDEGYHVLNDKRLSQKSINSARNSQNLDSISILSSLIGSEMSRSDPYLSDSVAYESEYDNYEQVRLLSANNDQLQSHLINSIDLNQFDNIDFDKIKINESMTTDDYIQSLQQHIDSHQAQRNHSQSQRHSCTDV